MLKDKVIEDDFTTPNITYFGIAVSGSATSAAVWKIIKIDYTQGAVYTLAEYGSNTNVWDDRTTLNYY